MNDGDAGVRQTDETRERLAQRPAVVAEKLVAVDDGRIAAAHHVWVETGQFQSGRRHVVARITQRVGDIDMPALVDIDGAAFLTRRPRTIGRPVERHTVQGKARGWLQIQHERHNTGVHQQRQQSHEGDETSAGQQRANAQLMLAQVAPYSTVALHTFQWGMVQWPTPNARSSAN